MKSLKAHTLIPVLDRFQKRFDLDKPIVVADAGLLSKDNLLNLKNNGYSFILGARIKNESRDIIEIIEEFTFTEGSIKKIERKDNTVLFVSYSDKRARKGF